jgi:hypothetical protein
MLRAKPKSYLRIALLLAPLSLGLGACETLENMNPFDEQKKPLTGERRQVFPQGVPGVQYNAPPTQPSNSNIAVTPDAQNPDALAPNTPNTPNAPRGPAQNNSDDPWAQRR